jgi:F0F1-type ATP synthase delta subunit
MRIQPPANPRYAQLFIAAVLRAGGKTAIDGEIAHLTAFSEVWPTSVELQKTLDSTQVKATERRGMIARLCERMGVSDKSRELFFSLNGRSLLGSNPADVDTVERSFGARHGTARARVESSRIFGVPAPEIPKLKAGEPAKSRIPIQCDVRTTVLGVLRMQVGPTVWEGAVRNHLGNSLRPPSR